MDQGISVWHLVIAGIALIFNAGGFVWLAKNHFHEVKDKLKEQDKLIFDIHTRVVQTAAKLDVLVELIREKQHASK